MLPASVTVEQSTALTSVYLNLSAFGKFFYYIVSPDEE